MNPSIDKNEVTQGGGEGEGGAYYVTPDTIYEREGAEESTHGANIIDGTKSNESKQKTHEAFHRINIFCLCRYTFVVQARKCVWTT